MLTFMRLMPQTCTWKGMGTLWLLPTINRGTKTFLFPSAYIAQSTQQPVSHTRSASSRIVLWGCAKAVLADVLCALPDTATQTQLRNHKGLCCLPLYSRTIVADAHGCIMWFQTHAHMCLSVYYAC